MKIRSFVVLAVGAVASLAGVRALSAPPAPRPHDPQETPVLVELFTSEGCSSCPPADAELERLAKSADVRGARVVVLAHHVDYWDQLGWPNPFSSAEATARQRGYAALGGGTYTPQAVVDGSTQLVGSRGAAIEEAIAAAGSRAHARITLAMTPSSGAPGTRDVAVDVGPLPAGAGNDAEIVLAVVQDRARVDVTRGENAGRTLDHVGVVRSLRVAGPVRAGSGPMHALVSMPSAIDAPDGTTFSIMALVQERSSRRVLGAATGRLTR